MNNKRIVIYDTLMQKMEIDEIVAVVCHELGHWQFNHFIKNMFV
jgi:STE24 endopeptidase